MILSELFTQINIAFRGSDDDVPVDGTPDYDLWLGTTNRKIAEWGRDSKNVWESNFSYNSPNEPGTVATSGTTTLTGTGTYFTDYEVGDTIVVSGETVRTIDTITSDTSLTVTVAFSNTASLKTFTRQAIISSSQSYSVHRNLLVPSDRVVIESTQNYEYIISKPQERSRYNNEVYFSGRNPQLITFTDTIVDGAVGGSLKIPGYYLPNDVSESTDIIPVDDPYWVVYAVASELAFNDLTYEDKYVDLNTKANNLYSQMVTANRRGTNNYPRVLRTNVARIPGTSSNTIGTES